MRVRSWPGLALGRPLWPGSAEGQGQGQTDCGPALEGQGQVRKNWAGPGPDRTSDSLNPNIRGATGREGRTDLKLENKSQCIKYKRDGGTTIEPQSTKDTVGDQGFWGRLQKRICKSLEVDW